MFIATNTDSTFPSATKGLLPGGGTMVQMLSYCSGQTPLVVGKPSHLLLEILKQKYDIDVSRTCMVGDRLNTVCFPLVPSNVPIS